MLKVIKQPINWQTTSIDSRGTLRVIENSSLPFVPVRHFYVSEVPIDSSRGCHAHIKCHQLLFVVAGHLMCKVIDKSGERVVSLSPSSDFLYLPPLTWAEQYDFHPGTIMGCLASEPYDPDDYIHDLDKFLKLCI
jgi:UDP-2-acetamido-3-amino-2,3-dideoxy-glucuronate N-acetyltransferase